MPRDGRSPGLWGALDAFYVRDAVEGNLRARLLELRRGRWRVGRVSRREGASAVSGFGDGTHHDVALALVHLGHPHVHQLEPRREVWGARMSAREGR